MTTESTIDVTGAPPVRSSALFGAWVDVNERRPEKMCHVLCATDSGYVDVSFFDPTAKLDELKLGRKCCGKWGRYFDLCKRGYKITHWMPMPKAPNDQALPQGGAKETHE